MATITGVGGTGSVGTLSILGQIIVSLLSDSGGTPGSLIAVLGVFNDTDLVLGTSILEIVLDLPITLVPNTRYWIQVSGNGATSYSWVQAGDDSGAGVADEFWYENDNGTITTGANADGPSFQMAVISEPSTGVYATTEVGSPAIALAHALSGVGATGAVASVTPVHIDVDLIGLEAPGEAGDATVSFANIVQPFGVFANGRAGMAAIPGKIVVSLLSDSDGSPDSLIAVLGVYEDADLTLGTAILEIDLSLAPLALTPNTRYWIEVTGNAFTSFSWVEAADDSGSGVATELWYQDIDGSISTGANSAGPSFQMEILAEPPTGVYGTGNTGLLYAEVDATISGVAATGEAGITGIPGNVDQPVDGVFARGYANAVRLEIDSGVIGVSGTAAAGAPSDREAGTVAGSVGSGTVHSLAIEIDKALAGATATGFAGTLTTSVVGTAVNVPITGVAGTGEAGKVTTTRPKRLRGGRGAPRKGDPTPRELETEAELLRRWRQTVDELLGLTPKEEQEEPEELPETVEPPFSFLSSLPKPPLDEAEPEPEPVEPPPEPSINWQAIAEAEDALLIGDLLGDVDDRTNEDILLLGDLL